MTEQEIEDGLIAKLQGLKCATHAAFQGRRSAARIT
jgi:hypothetical protein